MKTNPVRKIPLVKEQPVTESFCRPPEHQETFNDGVDGAKNQGHAEGDGGAWLKSHEINAIFVVVAPFGLGTLAKYGPVQGQR